MIANLKEAKKQYAEFIKIKRAVLKRNQLNPRASVAFASAMVFFGLFYGAMIIASVTTAWTYFKELYFYGLPLAVLTFPFVYFVRDDVPKTHIGNVDNLLSHYQPVSRESYVNLQLAAKFPTKPFFELDALCEFLQNEEQVIKEVIVKFEANDNEQALNFVSRKLDS